jgi:hypothetical protein
MVIQQNGSKCEYERLFIQNCSVSPTCSTVKRNWLKTPSPTVFQLESIRSEILMADHSGRAAWDMKCLSLMGSWVQIPVKAWVSVCISCVGVQAAALQWAHPPSKGSYWLSMIMKLKWNQHFTDAIMLQVGTTKRERERETDRQTDRQGY